MTYNTQAIILKRKDFREADMEITFLSKDYGKLKAVAIASKKITSKLAGNLEPWREVKVMLANGKQFDKVGQVVLMNNFNVQGCADLQSLIQAQKAMALVDKLIEVRQKEVGLYKFVKSFLHYNFLANFSKNISNYTIFGWKLIEFVGLNPQLKNCLKCGRSIKIESVNFDFLNGGLICLTCNKDEEKTLRINESVTGWLKAIQQYPFEKLITQEMSENTNKELENILNLFLKFHLN